MSFVLSIDQASNAAGVALFKDDKLLAHTVLKSDSPKDPYGKRLVTQIKQLEIFLDEHLGVAEIDQLLFEGVRSSYVLTVVGGFCTARQLQNCKFSPKACFVGALSWKKYARDRGATGKFGEIKGVKALREIGFDVDHHGITSDDVSDAVMMFFCYRQRNGFNDG
jgi:hypothetical protein